ncbi:SCP2 sterol-binding domain [Trinorchestia longiramus]|nr:SCP2 sterol-binding domain [Trinorchestia longiramus]
MIANTGKLAGRTIFITGASRGIGKALALKAAKDGANIVVAAKTAEAHPKLPGTIYTAAKEIESAGGKALPYVVDVRDEASVAASVDAAVQQFGGIDILINNASAISLTGTLETSMKKYDLMHQINTRGTYLVSKLCLPHLLKGQNPHILNISPPLNMKPRWFKDHVAYTMAKYGMSMCVLAMAEEFRDQGVAVNALWPRTAIHTAAMDMLGGAGIASKCRKPEIMADAGYAILSRDSKTFTGNFCIDDDVLKEEGITDFNSYACDPKEELMPDFFLDAFDEAVAQSVLEKKNKPAAVKAEEAAGAEAQEIAKIFGNLQSVITPEVVEKTKAIYAFHVTVPGGEASRWWINLKEGSGGVGEGSPSSPADVTFTLNADIFGKLFSGNLKPTAAVMSGKMKLKGDIGKAMKLEGLMGKLKSKL